MRLDQEAGPHDVRECRVQGVSRLSVEDGERGKVRDVAEAGQLLQRLLARGRQAIELGAHEIEDVVGVAFLADERQVPGPGSPLVVAPEQLLLGELGEELGREERIAARLLVHQLRDRPRVLLGAAQGLGDEPGNIVEPERRQHDLMDRRAGCTDLVEGCDQRMSRIDFGVAVGADDHQVRHAFVGDQMLHHVERGVVEPLQVVEKQDERALGPRKGCDEAPEHRPEPDLCFRRRKLGQRRLRPDHQLELGNEVHHQLAVGAHGGCDGVAPARELGIVPAEDETDLPLEGLGQGGVGNVALVLVDLAGGEERVPLGELLAQRVDDGRLADAGIARHQHELGHAGGRDALEGGQQRVDLALAAIERLRNPETVGGVVRAEREGSDPPVRFPFGEAAAQVGFEAGGGLVALLHRLREQLQHDEGDGGGNRSDPLVGRDRLARDMTVDQLEGIGRRERRRACQHLVEGGAQGIEIAARIDRTIDAAGLLRRHVGQRPGHDFGRRAAVLVLGRARGDAEAGEPDAAEIPVDEHVGRLDVLVNEAAGVHVAARHRERDRDAQEIRQGQRLTEQQVERLAARVVQDQRHPIAIVGERERPRGPTGIQHAPQRVFMLEQFYRLDGGLFAAGRDQEDRIEPIGGAPVKREFAFPHQRERIV